MLKVCFKRSSHLEMLKLLIRLRENTTNRVVRRWYVATRPQDDHDDAHDDNAEEPNQEILRPHLDAPILFFWPGLDELTLIGFSKRFQSFFRSGISFDFLRKLFILSNDGCC